MRGLRILIVIPIVLLAIYLLGPRVQAPEVEAQLPDLGLSLDNLEEYIEKHESKTPNLKPDNEARIIWAGDTGVRTPYSIVYLHGFSASPAEGSPVQEALAKRYGANLFQARLYGHGTDVQEAFLDATGEKLMASAREALAIGHLLGDSVIVMSCSSGSTLALYLAAHHPDLHSLLLYSPNIDFAKPGSFMLTRPWGLQLARIMMGGKYRSFDGSAEMQKYWTCKYRLEGLVYLKKLVETTMTKETFGKIRQPMFLAYYYKNENEQDEIVKVSKMLTMFEETSTPVNKKRKQAFPDAEEHVLLSDITSKDVAGVMKASFDFCDEVLDMVPVINDPAYQTKRSR